MADVHSKADQTDFAARGQQIVPFHDATRGSEHDRFMDWRHEHPGGFYLTLKSNQRANLHRAACAHQGDYTYGDHEGWGSATKALKVCADTQEPLHEWAKSQGVVVHRCESCL